MTLEDEHHADRLAEAMLTAAAEFKDSNGLSMPIYPDMSAVRRIAGEALAPEKANPTGIQPTEFKVLILPDPVEDKVGSIIMPDSKKDSDKYATIEGRIVAISHLAFSYATAEEWGSHKPKAGNRVIFAKYAGIRRKGKDGVEYLLINDKDVVALIDD